MDLDVGSHPISEIPHLPSSPAQFTSGIPVTDYGCVVMICPKTPPLIPAQVTNLIIFLNPKLWCHEEKPESEPVE